MLESNDQNAALAWTAVRRGREVLRAVLALVLTAGAVRVAGIGVFDDLSISMD